MHTELEKTQLELAKAQLAQEQMKLAKMQRNQQALNSLGQGAAVLGEGAAKGVGRLIATLIIWVVCFVVISLVTAVALVPALGAKDIPGGFVHAYGYFLGLSAHITIPAVLIISTLCAVMFLCNAKTETTSATFILGLFITVGLVYLTV